MMSYDATQLPFEGWILFACLQCFVTLHSHPPLEINIARLEGQWLFLGAHAHHRNSHVRVIRH